MKKLSDYRIKETADGFIIEKFCTYDIFWVLGRKEESKWFPLDKKGRELTRDCVYEISLICTYDTIESAKAQIIKWCEEPKYHYVREFEGYSYSQNFSKGCPWDFADFYKEQLSRAGIEYFAKCNVEKELLKINPPFCKLIEKYEEKVRTGWNPKAIEKSYADLVLENFELTIKNKELEIQLHGVEKKPNK